ncbi:MAG TPA: hypothetical protein VGM56_10990 [Byssovorax sp.]
MSAIGHLAAAIYVVRSGRDVEPGARRIAEQIVCDAAERLLGPELEDFASAVVAEAAHQRVRWGTPHDGGKAPADWFWLLGYLSGKALAAAIAGDRNKAAHHTISSAAALANWHAALRGASTEMRPGSERAADDGAS